MAKEINYIVMVMKNHYYLYCLSFGANKVAAVAIRLLLHLVEIDCHPNTSHRFH